ncbi:MAG: hypothetical protein J4G09_11650 [Proteobacteria bacterium]|nr:hypothetical protein [Pseudomonadota bacterium]
MRSLAVRDPQGLDIDACPGDIRVGHAQFDSGRPVALVAARRPGEDLLGWGILATQHPDVASKELVIAAPFHPPLVERLAARAASLGLSVHLLSVPGLAEASDEISELHSYPDVGRLHPLEGLLSVEQRVIRVLEGASALTSLGGTRRTSAGWVLYVRGKLAAQVRRDGDGVAVSLVLPQKRRIFVTESNFPRWGIELHEMVIQLTQDPRLLDETLGDRERAVEKAAADAGAALTATWIPCSPDGDTCLDWVGVDSKRRAAIGLISAEVGPEQAATLATGQLLVLENRAVWAAGSDGPVQACLSAAPTDPLAAGVVDLLAGETPIEAPRPRLIERAPRPPRPRRERHAASGEETSEGTEPPDSEEGQQRRGRRRPRRRRRGGRGLEASPTDPEAQDESPREGQDEALDDADRPEASAGAVEPTEPEAEPEAPSEVEDPAAETAVGVQAEPELEEEQGETSEDELEDESPDEIRELPRQRRMRAAIVVCNEPESILAALVLARDRRTTTQFVVLPQAELMDYFKGSANDVGENEDLLVVGFTAQPHVRDLLDTAELFRGRLQWFDHHSWPIEDLERLRSTVGRDSILIEPAATPLYCVNQVTERRSRFTDKLIDLSGSRLQDSDMEKWGYRLIELVRRLAESSGDQRPQIGPVLSGKPAELPSAGSIFENEADWVERNDPRMVHFGDHELALFEVPAALDAGEVARRFRGRTGARLSLGSRAGDDLILLGCNDEKRPLNVTGMAEAVDACLSWTHALPGGDRLGRLRIEDRADHPDRIQRVVREIVRQRSVLYG